MFSGVHLETGFYDGNVLHNIIDKSAKAHQ
jgi:hypothetical protein